MWYDSFTLLRCIAAVIGFIIFILSIVGSVCDITLTKWVLIIIMGISGISFGILLYFDVLLYIVTDR